MLGTGRRDHPGKHDNGSGLPSINWQKSWSSLDLWHTKAGGHRLPLPFDQVSIVNVPARPARLPVSKGFWFADLRVSKPERLLYASRSNIVKFGQRGSSSRAARSVYGSSGPYAVGVAACDAAGIGSALASV